MAHGIHTNVVVEGFNNAPRHRRSSKGDINEGCSRIDVIQGLMRCCRNFASTPEDAEVRSEEGQHLRLFPLHVSSSHPPILLLFHIMSSIKFLLGLCTLAVINGVVALGPAPVILGTAANYAVLAKSAISTVPSSAITGDIGISPAAASFLTGFSLTLDSTNTFSRSLQIVGKAFAANYAVPSPTQLTVAVLNMQTAFTDANSRANPNSLNLGAGTLNSQTLAPGLYKWTTGLLIPTDLTFQGSATDTWILQVAGTLTLATNKKVVLLGGALPKNIVWVMSGTVTLGAGAHIEGIVLSATSITLATGASINGRLLSQTAVNLQKAIVKQP